MNFNYLVSVFCKNLFILEGPHQPFLLIDHHSYTHNLSSCEIKA